MGGKNSHPPLKYNATKADSGMESADRYFKSFIGDVFLLTKPKGL